MKKIELTRKQLIEHNKAVATFWLKNCPKTYRTKKLESLAQKHTTGLLYYDNENPEQTIVLERLYNGSPFCWKLFEDFQRAPWNEKHAQLYTKALNEMRTKAKACEYNGKNLRINIDGVNIALSDDYKKGKRKVFYTQGNTPQNLSDFGQADIFLFTFYAKKIVIFKNSDSKDIAYIIETPQQMKYSIYRVTGGWKIHQAA